MPGGNPYHDARGRFTTASGNRTGASVPAYGRGRPNTSPDPSKVLGLPDSNGRWKYNLVEKKDLSGQTYHEWEIAPTTAPASKTLTLGDQSRTIYFDPKLTQVTNDGTGYRPTLKENKLSSLNPQQGMIWRGMSAEEYHAAKANGYIESRGSYNIGGDLQAGKTYFSTSPDQAANYASWYAPAQFKPSFNKPAYVVGIPDRPTLAREQSTEVGVPGRVPFASVQHVYKGSVFAVIPGSQGAYQDGNTWEQAGGSHPSPLVVWTAK